jgi:hypothetical protein
MPTRRWSRPISGCSLRAKPNLLKQINLICPVQSHLKKFSASPPTQIKSILLPSRPTEGRIAIVTDAGWDAVDAGGASDEGACLRTAKSCGPDAPTLASSWRRRLRRRRWQESPVTGESTKETVKTIARGMPGDSGVTVVTNSRVFLLHARLRALRAPGIPCALIWGRKVMQDSGASRRERAELCLASLRGANGSRECAPDDRLRGEAIHSCCPVDCFASLAMTELAV